MRVGKLKVALVLAWTALEAVLNVKVRRSAEKGFDGRLQIPSAFATASIERPSASSRITSAASGLALAAPMCAAADTTGLRSRAVALNALGLAAIAQNKGCDARRNIEPSLALDAERLQRNLLV